MTTQYQPKYQPKTVTAIYACDSHGTISIRYISDDELLREDQVPFSSVYYQTLKTKAEGSLLVMGAHTALMTMLEYPELLEFNDFVVITTDDSFANWLTSTYENVTIVKNLRKLKSIIRKTSRSVVVLGGVQLFNSLKDVIVDWVAVSHEDVSLKPNTHYVDECTSVSNAPRHCKVDQLRLPRNLHWDNKSVSNKVTIINSLSFEDCVYWGLEDDTKCTTTKGKVITYRLS